MPQTKDEKRKSAISRMELVIVRLRRTIEYRYKCSNIDSITNKIKILEKDIENTRRKLDCSSNYLF